MGKRATNEKTPERTPEKTPAERVFEANSQNYPLDYRPEGNNDFRSHGVDYANPNEGAIERTMEEYQGETDMEGQGGEPKEPPDTNPLPVQNPRKPKAPPKHNM
jgi:hypothetical protein